MNLTHLKYFFDTAAKGSVTHAAKINFVSQSAISQGLKALETHLDCSLLVHRRRQVELTDLGRAVFEGCKNVFSSIEDLESLVKAQQDGTFGRLSIGCTNSVAIHILPKHLNHIRNEYPNIQIQLKLGNSRTIQRWLLEREVAMGIFVEEPELMDPSITSKPLLEGRYMVVKNQSCKKPLHEVSVLVTRKDRPEVLALYETYSKERKSRLSPPMEILSWEVINSLVLASNQMVGLVPDYVATEEIKAKRLKEYRPRISLPPYKLSYFRLNQKSLSKSYTLLIESLKGH